MSTVATGITGILIARAVGPEARGEYAAVIAWFGVTLTVGELGQTAATTYFVAKDRINARDYTATSRSLMLVTGLATLLIGFAFAPMLARGSASALAEYRVMFGTCIVSYIGASLTFSLQAVATIKWNVVRLFQPFAFAIVVWLLHALGELSIINCLYALSFTILLQTILAYSLCYLSGLTGGNASKRVAATMARYGASQVAASVPAVVVSRLDLLALSLSVEPQAVGHYAVAASLTSMAGPAVSAIGAVTFPRIASQHERDPRGARRLMLRAVVFTAIASALIALALMSAAHWLIPVAFGPQYRQAVPLVLILAPGGALLACCQVCSDILRGYGRPLTVARVQWIGAAITALVMALLLPAMGVFGAALTMAISAASTLILLLLSMRKIGRGGPAVTRPTRTEDPI